MCILFLLRRVLVELEVLNAANVDDRPQWSYKKGLAAGVLPAKAYEKSFDCTGGIPSFSDLPEYY